MCQQELQLCSAVRDPILSPKAALECRRKVLARVLGPRSGIFIQVDDYQKLHPGPWGHSDAKTLGSPPHLLLFIFIPIPRNSQKLKNSTGRVQPGRARQEGAE